MKLSKHTTEVLKNFSSINQNIQFKQGKVLSTISSQRNILASAEIEEEFLSDFAIYDLNQLLGALSLFNNPELTIGDTKLSIKTDNSTLNYIFADSSMIVSPPEKKLDFPDPEIKFSLKKEELDSVLRAAHVLQVPELAVVGDGTLTSVVATDTSNTSTNEFAIQVGETDKTFKMIFKIENIKLISGSYDVEISSKGISYWAQSGKKLQYWIATESNSKYQS